MNTIMTIKAFLSESDENIDYTIFFKKMIFNFFLFVSLFVGFVLFTE